MRKIKRNYRIDYLNKCDFDNLDIWEMQKSLKKTDAVEVDFEDNVAFVVTQNEIYLLRWDPRCLIPDMFLLWKSDMIDNYTVYEYIQLTDHFYENFYENRNYWCKILMRVVEKCKYTSDYTKEEAIKYIQEGMISPDLWE